MPSGSIFVRVLAYGVPALLIVLGFFAVTGGEIAGMIFGTSSGMVILGVAMIIFGILLYILEIFLGVR